MQVFWGLIVNAEIFKKVKPIFGSEPKVVIQNKIIKEKILEMLAFCHFSLELSRSRCDIKTFNLKGLADG